MNYPHDYEISLLPYAMQPRVILQRAIEDGDIELVRRLVLIDRVPLDGRNGRWRGTSLHVAAWCGQLEIAKFLLSQPNNTLLTAKDELGWVAMRAAIKIGHLPLVQFFIEKGMPIEYQDDKNRTFLHDASVSPSAEIAEYLLSNGADRLIDRQDCMDRTPLHDAAVTGTSKAVKVLLQR